MKQIILSLLLLIIVFQSSAIEDNNWSTSNIPQELLVKAIAVGRNAEITVTVFANGSVEEYVKIATTVLNENGERFGYFVEPYDKYSSISGLEGVVFDKNGKKIRKIKYEEFVDISAIQGFSIYEDNRLKVANPRVGDYPYTVVYEYKKKHKSFFAIPGWQVYRGTNFSIQNSSYKLVLEKGAIVNYKGNEKFKIEPIVTEEKNFKSILWSIQNQPALEDEPLSVSFTELSPILKVAPLKFSMNGFDGANSSWHEFGNWSYNLGKGRNTLPEATVEKVNSIIGDANNDFEKAKRLYEYMQGKVRYVSIQVGIGGFQPFPAETVDRLSYGDCKALTNYMKSLLDVSGIKSYYCLVKAGDDSPNIDKSFVCSQFNHAFLMLPLNKDTLYLECTSQNLPFGYNGTFTDDRDILVIDSTNSYIKHTNVYSKEKNKTTNSFLFQLDNDLNATVIQQSRYIGVATEPIRNLKEIKPEKQRDIIVKRFKLRQVKITKLNYNETKDVVPVIEENIEYVIPQIAQLTNNNSILLPFNQVTQMNDLKRVNNRKSDICIRRSEIQIDTIKYFLPKNLNADVLPAPNSISSQFGSYKLEVDVKNNTITFIKTIEWKKGVYKPTEYSDLIQYQRKINEMDRQVILLKRK